jgi:hypothetical protein
LQSILGVILVSDYPKYSSSDSLCVPSAEFSKGLVVTQLSCLYKIIIRALKDRWALIVVAIGRHRARVRFELQRFLS